MIANQRHIEADDLDLLRRFAGGRDPEALRLLVHRHYPMVLSTCRRRLRCASDAEDAAQEVFVSLMAHAGSIRANVGGWLNRCARNRTTTLIRARRSRTRREIEKMRQAESAAVLGPDPKIERLASLESCLQQIEPMDRNLLIRNCVAGVTQQEIAAAMGVSQQAVAKRLGKTILQLRRALLSRAGAVAVALGLIAFLRRSVLAAGRLAGFSPAAPGLPAASGAAGLKISLAAAVVLTTAAASYEYARPAPAPSRLPPIAALNHSYAGLGVGALASHPVVARAAGELARAAPPAPRLPVGASLMHASASTPHPLTPEPITFEPRDPAAASTPASGVAELTSDPPAIQLAAGQSQSELPPSGRNVVVAAPPLRSIAKNPKFDPLAPVVTVADPAAAASDSAPVLAGADSTDAATLPSLPLQSASSPLELPFFKTLLQDPAAAFSDLLWEAVPGLKPTENATAQTPNDFDAFGMHLGKTPAITANTLILHTTYGHVGFLNPHLDESAALPDFQWAAGGSSGSDWLSSPGSVPHSRSLPPPDMIAGADSSDDPGLTDGTAAPSPKKWTTFADPLQTPDNPLTDINDPSQVPTQSQENPNLFNVQSIQSWPFFNGTSIFSNGALAQDARVQGAVLIPFGGTSTGVVPEPASLALLGLGALVLLRRRGRRP